MDSDWEYLPDILLEDIFCRLNWRDRKSCSQVCSNWYEMFHSPRVWRELVVTEKTFTYSRFNLYKGYQLEVSTHKVQNCLARVGENFRHIIIRPNPNFHNLYNVLSVLASFLVYFEEYPMPLLKRFEFTFACETMDVWSHEMVVLGTGGRLLEELKKLIGSTKELKEIVINNLLLESKETPGFMDTFLLNNKHSLTYMEVLNFTRYRHPLFYAGLFPNLRTVVLSPTQLSDTVVVMIAEKTKVKLLVIVQDRYTGDVECVTSHGWWEVKQVAPKLQVRLEVRGRTDSELLIQPLAPVHSIMYDSCQSRVNMHVIIQICEEYKHTLRCYGHKSIHRRFTPRSFFERADTVIMMLIRECIFLQTLVISERISTCTLLLIAAEGKNLKELHVRKNAVVLKFDWPKSTAWSTEYHSHLKKTSQSYEETEKEISVCLDQPNWSLLSDKQFLLLKV